MALFRTDEEDKVRNFGSFRQQHILIPNEWDSNNGQTRDLESTWEGRYRHEAGLIHGICQANGYAKILELGSGPGRLGQFVQELNPYISYSYIDKIEAKKEFEKRGFRGTFHVKDMMNGLDVSGLDTDYDFVVANDFLEHVANPSDIVFKIRSVTKDNAGFFASVPNWRMGHGFIYRGLFDFDNWVYFCRVHGWNVETVDGSHLKCEPLPKLSSEDLLPDDLITSWNWYFNSKKVNT
jgi:2-polyprenyl-3-methyl-5-hydroxy-6-metoxy-1,4-benzoquinol methylase